MRLFDSWLFGMAGEALLRPNRTFCCYSRDSWGMPDENGSKNGAVPPIRPHICIDVCAIEKVDS